MVEMIRAHTRAALFVDFDNVYLGLQALDRRAAERFATDPGSWMQAIAEGDGHGSSRRFLVRNCYLNPNSFSKYRPDWTRAGFRVIDCPSLTQQGKSSTDINLVLDAVDVLAGEVRVDEFFIASADADFTSLIQRIRAADRMTTVIVAGAVASAYRSMADSIVEADDFLELLSDAQPAAGSSATPRVSAAPRRTSIPSAAPAVTDVVSDDSEPATPFEAVLQAVRHADGPVTAAVLALRARMVDPSVSDDWDGLGTFGAWLRQFPNEIGTTFSVTPGWGWDLTRFSAESVPLPDDGRSALQKRVSRVTDVPRLSRDQFHQVLTSLAEVLSSSPFDPAETAKAVRDGCTAAGTAVGRGPITFVIHALLRDGGGLERGSSATAFAERWARQVQNLCDLAQLDFDDAETKELRDWVGGGLLDT